MSAEIVVKNNVCDSLDVTMPGDRHGRNVAIAAVDRVHSNDPFRRTLPEKMWIFLDQILPVTVADHKIEVAFLEQVVFNTG